MGRRRFSRRHVMRSIAGRGLAWLSISVLAFVLVMPGVNVTLTNEASGDQRRTVTNADGFFAFAAVPAGNYTVAIELQGFRKTEMKGVGLRGGDSRSLRTI